MPDPGPHPAAEWLIGEYDATDNPFRDLDDAHGGVLWRGIYVQPIFTLKSAMDGGKQMRISARDYADPDRRFL